MQVMTFQKIRNVARLQLKKTWVQWVLATIFLLVASWYFMGTNLTSCSANTAALNSDSTGGIAWFQWAGGNDLSWERTAMSNFPEGEETVRPFSVTSSLFTGFYRVLAALTTPVCGLNLLALLGYILTGLLMFGLARWLFKNFFIASFAAFAAAFVPYHQLKATGHLVYVYGAPFIAIIWAFLWFVSKPSYRRALLVAALTAAAFYTDGYFSLLAATLIGGLVVALLLRSTLKATLTSGWVAVNFGYQQFYKNIKQYYKHLIAIGGIIFLFLIPVVLTVLSQGSKIQGSLSAARGDIRIEAMDYSVRGIQFVAPPHNSALFPNNVETWQARSRHSNISEGTLYAGYGVYILCALGLAFVLKRSIRSSLLVPNITYGAVILFVCVALGACLLLSMPPRITFFGQSIPTPSLVLIKLTANWRVLARFFLVIHPLLVVLAAAGLFGLRVKLKKKAFYGLLVLFSILLLAEYTPTAIRNSAHLYNDAPKVFVVMNQDPAVKAVAEYPLLDFIYTPTTFTFQQVHNKPVLNANDSGLIRSPLNQVLAGLANPQTLGILKARGISHVTTHGIDLSALPGLEQYRAPDDSGLRIGMATLYTYKIADSVQPRATALVPQSGFDVAVVDTKQVTHHVLSRPGTLAVVPTTNVNVEGKQQVSFTAVNYSSQSAHVVFSQNGTIVWEGAVENKQPVPISFQVLPGEITVSTSAPISLSGLATGP